MSGTHHKHVRSVVLKLGCLLEPLGEAFKSPDLQAATPDQLNQILWEGDPGISLSALPGNSQ